jgi:hypothetical protein
MSSRMDWDASTQRPGRLTTPSTGNGWGSEQGSLVSLLGENSQRGPAPRQTMGPGQYDPAPEEQTIFHGMALARDPTLENYGWRIVVGFTVAFGAILLGLRALGNEPGQSFSLKSISDILQFCGEFIGLFFTLRITNRLYKASKLLHQQLYRQEQRAESANALVSLRAEAQAASRAWVAWLLLSIAIVFYASGQAGWTSYDVRMASADVPYPGYYDIGFVGSYPFFLLGTLLLTRRNRAAIGRARLVMDAVAVLGAALALSWFFVLGPSFAGLPNTVGFGAKFVSIYFPTGDLFLVAVGAFLMFSPLSTREQQSVLVRLCLGLFVLAVTDSLLVYFSLSFSFNTGTLQDLLWPLSLMLVGLAAVEFPRSVAREQEAEARLANPSLVRSTLSGSSNISQVSATLQTIAPFLLALATCALLLTVVAPAGGATLFQADVSALVLIVLVVIRQGLTLIENTRLNMQLRGELVVQGRQLQVTRRVAAEASEAAQQKDVLEQGIAQLQDTHARIARGDFSARALAVPGPLLPVAMSFNLMLDRLSTLAARVTEYDQLQREIQIAREGLERLAAGFAPWLDMQSAPRSVTPMGPVFLQMNQLHRSQQHLWRNLFNALESQSITLRRLRESLTEVWNTTDASQRVPLEWAARALDQLEKHHHQLLEQIRALSVRLDQPG